MFYHYSGIGHKGSFAFIPDDKGIDIQFLDIGMIHG
jgi:hypothetical protein